jgi:hypothetical protein
MIKIKFENMFYYLTNSYNMPPKKAVVPAAAPKGKAPKKEAEVKPAPAKGKATEVVPAAPKVAKPKLTGDQLVEHVMFSPALVNAISTNLIGGIMQTIETLNKTQDSKSQIDLSTYHSSNEFKGTMDPKHSFYTNTNKASRFMISAIIYEIVCEATAVSKQLEKTPDSELFNLITTNAINDVDLKSSVMAGIDAIIKSFKPEVINHYFPMLSSDLTATFRTKFNKFGLTDACQTLLVTMSVQLIKVLAVYIGMHQFTTHVKTLKVRFITGCLRSINLNSGSLLADKFIQKLHDDYLAMDTRKAPAASEPEANGKTSPGPVKKGKAKGKAAADVDKKPADDDQDQDDQDDQDDQGSNNEADDSESSEEEEEVKPKQKGNGTATKKK